ncbi:MAG: hypothetical protein P4L40_12140 [Terracidiphilus sp.]|nr:hypothetical protein [Terracidiphilus sp.]
MPSSSPADVAAKPVKRPKLECCEAADSQVLTVARTAPLHEVIKATCDAVDQCVIAASACLEVAAPSCDAFRSAHDDLVALVTAAAVSAHHEGKCGVAYTDKVLDAAWLCAEADRDLLACVAAACDVALAAGDDAALTAAWAVVNAALPLLNDVEAAGLACVAFFHNLPVPQGDVLGDWATVPLDGAGGVGDSLVLSGPGVCVYAVPDAEVEGSGHNIVRVAPPESVSSKLLPLLGLSGEWERDGCCIPLSVTLLVRADDVQARYVVPPSATGPVRLQATVCGVHVGQSVSVPPGQGVGGRCVGAIPVGVGEFADSTGLTVTRDGAHLVYVQATLRAAPTHYSLSLFALPSWQYVRRVQTNLRRPRKLCATQANTLLIAEEGCVVEMDLHGAVVREIGHDSFNFRSVVGVATNDVLVAASLSASCVKPSPSIPLIYLFGYASGALLRTFGPRSTNPMRTPPFGTLHSTSAVRFCGDSMLVAADSEELVLSYLTLAGECVFRVIWSGSHFVEQTRSAASASEFDSEVWSVRNWHFGHRDIEVRSDGTVYATASRYPVVMEWARGATDCEGMIGIVPSRRAVTQHLALEPSRDSSYAALARHGDFLYALNYSKQRVEVFAP